MMIINTKYLFFLLLSFLFLSCSNSINLLDYIDKSKPFQITINQINPKTGLAKTKTFKLPVKSEKWIKLIDWMKKNESGWKYSPVSYNPQISIIQGNLRLLYLTKSGSVVVGFIDNKGKPKQYVKSIKNNNLDFLITTNDNSQVKSNNKRNCQHCNFEVLKKVSENIGNLTYENLKNFLCTMDQSCKNNVEYSEWSNELLFKIIEKYPNLYFNVLKDVENKKQKFILSEIENPVIEVNYQKIYNGIERLDIEKNLKNEYLNLLITIAKKDKVEIIRK